MKLRISAPVSVRTLVAVAAYALPALALSIPSGYSWGALLLCIAALIAMATSPSTARPRGALAWFTASMLFMGLVYASDAWLSGPWQWNGLDKPAKFALAAIAIAAVIHSPASPLALKFGIWSGAVGAGATALWQVKVQGMDRAWGYTNAIQFGDIALLLSVWSWAWAYQDTGRTRWLGWLAGSAGLYACVASEARGGWAMVPVLIALMVWQHRAMRPLDRRVHITRTAWWKVMVTLAITLTLAWPVLADRSTQAWLEIQQFHKNHEVNTSVGQRLAHWQLAYNMGTEKPWLGWGEEGYVREKQRLLNAGEIEPILTQMGHAHNDWLELWVKKGLIGVLALLLLLLTPLITYWRMLNNRFDERATTIDPAVVHERSTRHTVALCGLTLVVGFFGFGQTQVMFAHNSGTMVYLFMNLLFLSVCTASNTMSPGFVTKIQKAAD